MSVPRRALGRASLALAAATLLAAAAHAADADVEAAAPTFAADVAPLVYESCLPCHREDGVAPFPLETYEQVRRRARQIVEVTRSRFMPPWKPDPGHGEFLDERRLDDAQIEMLARWLAAGAELGDPARVPARPDFPSGWQLGEPDLVVALEEGFALPAGGPDVFRSFVLPIPEAAGRVVEAIELRPGNARVVHHATIYADATGAARQLDELDAEPGYPGMQVGVPPGGHFFGWTPGRTPRRLGEGMGWVVEPDTDLIVEAHLLPSGKFETIRPVLGLHFTDRPPTRIPATVRLGSTTIDIPAGAARHVEEDAFVLPVDVEAFAIYPHAHYLGRSVEARAVLPDGAVRPLIRISDWDFAWQDEYRYRSPQRLPRGTRVEMRYVYDNSRDNPRNPHDPPRRVTWGPRSNDEMGDLWLSVLPDDDAELPRLLAAIRDKDLELRIRGFERRVGLEPDDFESRSRLGQLLLARRDHQRALPQLEAALRLQPGSWHVQYNLGVVKTRLGRLDEAAAHYRAAAEAQPDRAQVHNNLGVVLMIGGDDEGAAAAFRRALELLPDLVQARVNFGVVLSRLGRHAEAVEQYAAALAARPDYAEAHSNLASALMRLGRLDEATRHGEEALRLRPTYVAPLKNLALIAVQEGDAAAAVARLEQAVRLAPQDPDAHLLLASQLEALGRRAEAIEHYESVLALVPGAEDARRGIERLRATRDAR